jgi:hypothetical protein
MSARDLVLPESAARQTLAFISGDLDSLERRLRWPGSVRFAQEASVALTESVPETLVTLTLDPGSWWVLGGTQASLDSAGSLYSVTLDLFGVTSAGIEVGGDSEPIVGDLDSMTVVGYSRLTTTTVIELELLWVTATPSSGTANDCYLIAIPA